MLVRLSSCPMASINKTLASSNKTQTPGSGYPNFRRPRAFVMFPRSLWGLGPLGLAAISTGRPSLAAGLGFCNVQVRFEVQWRRHFVRGGSDGPRRDLLLCLIDMAPSGDRGSLWLRRRRIMVVTLWAAMIVGTALWGYGLFVTGTAPIIDWKSNAPWWIADYLPNIVGAWPCARLPWESCALLAAQALRSQAPPPDQVRSSQLLAG